ncbi:MAG TPA: hypothetical protein VFM39_05460 [bacterium]|nr:hypothetical protein [bacterium]
MLVTTVVIMLAAGLVAVVVRAVTDFTPGWSLQKAYFVVNVAGLVMGLALLASSVARPDLRRYLAGFVLITLVMAARLSAQIFPLSIQADILMVSATLPLGLAGGALVIWEWQRMRSAGPKTR